MKAEKILDRISGLLSQHGIPEKQLTPITNGASGAFVFDVAGKYIAKYAQQTARDAKVYPMFVTEYDFYRKCSSKGYEFIPKVVFQTATQDELIIVLQKYTPIHYGEWDDGLIHRAMRLCARINAIDTGDFAPSAQSEGSYGDDYDSYPLSTSYANWCLLQQKFPVDIDASSLEAMYKAFAQIRLEAEALAIPKTLCHGDFHPGNFLREGDNLLICDWQTVRFNRGIGDVSFFINRGTDMGITINRQQTIEAYHDSIHAFTSEKIEMRDLNQYVAAADFYVSFKFWAEHLQSSDKSRVLDIYNSMVASYKSLIR